MDIRCRQTIRSAHRAASGRRFGEKIGAKRIDAERLTKTIYEDISSKAGGFCFGKAKKE